MFVCERMTELRMQAGYPPEQFRRMVDIPPQKYTQIEAGKLAPNCYEVSRIARALNVTTDYLLGMDIPSPPEIAKEDSPDDNFRIRFIRLLQEKCETYEDIAEITGKGIATVRNWKTGQNKPSISTLIILAQHFGCTTDYLLGFSMQRNCTEV